MWKNFIFHPILMCFSQMICYEKWNKSFNKRLFVKFIVFLLKGSKGSKMRFCWRWEIFILFFFLHLIPHKKLSVVCQQIFSMFYRSKRGHSGGGGIQFRIWKNFIFNPILLVFFNVSTWKSNKSYLKHYCSIYCF